MTPKPHPPSLGSIAIGSVPPDSVPQPGGAAPAAGPAAPPGYRVVRLLGRGGMGAVYLVHNEVMDRPEVLKVVQPDLLDRPGFRERFHQEVRNAAKLQHPNIVTAYCCLKVGDGLAFAMEYVPGQDLYALVRESGPLPVVAACHYARQAALGLQHAHERGMVHRDIKPHNLIRGKDGNKPVVKVLDFGLAKAAGDGPADGGLTGSNQMMGTPDYIAPEQILDAARADIRADIYGLGCTLYYLLTGSPPFAGLSLYETLEAHHFRQPAPIRNVRPDVPAELDAVVARMLAKDPAQRHQTPGEVAQALLPFLKAGGRPPKTSPVRDVPFAEPVPTRTGGPTVAPTPSTAPAAQRKGQTPAAYPLGEIEPPAPRPRPRRSPVGWIAAGLGALLVLVVGGLWAGGAFKTKPPAAVAKDDRPRAEAAYPDPKPVAGTPKPPDPKPAITFQPVPIRKLDSRTLGFFGRTEPEKRRLIEEWGGTPDSEAAVALGLKWLAGQQKADGSWAEDKVDPVAATGLALTAFLGAGHTPRVGDHKTVVDAGLKYLLARQTAEGWVQADGRNLHAHALATTALCEALGMTGDRAHLLGPARKAVERIVAAQAADGSWGTAPGQGGNMVHVIGHVQALAAARMSREITVPAETWRKVSKFLDGVSAGMGQGRFGYRTPEPMPHPTAMGLLARIFADAWPRDRPELADGVNYLLQQPLPRRGRFDPTGVYYQSQVIRYHQGDEWHKTWNPPVRGLLTSLQSTAADPAEGGSWSMTDFLPASPPSRLSATCHALLILETYYRHAGPPR